MFECDHWSERTSQPGVTSVQGGDGRVEGQMCTE